MRTRERSGPVDTQHIYGGTGFLRDRKLVLNWAAEDRPDTFGVLYLSANEEWQMEGFTVFTPQDTGKAEALPIWFRHI